MSLVSSMNIAREGMTVSQAGITTVSNNIANIDTEGYSKLKLAQSSVASTYDPKSQSPVVKAESLSGVTVDAVTRYSDSYLQSSYWDKSSSSSFYSSYSSSAAQVQDITNELNTTGITTAISKFYTAASAVSGNSADKTLRANYVSAAQNVASTFNSASTSLTNLHTSLVGTIGNTDSSTIATNINSANTYLDQLAKINDSIKSTRASDGTPSSSLLDQRDSLVTKITQLTNVSTSENKDGTINVSLGQNVLVNSSKVTGHLSAYNEGDASTADTSDYITKVNVVDPSTNKFTADVTSDITGGSIGAILAVSGSSTSGNLTINSVLSSLNGMASSFASVLNTIQTTADSNGTPMALNSTGTALQAVHASDVIFNTSDGSSTITAANLQVNSSIVSDPYKIAAARVTNTSDTTATGNNSNMKEIIDARTNASYYNGTAISGSTLEGAISSEVSSIGTDVSSIKASATTSASVLSQAKSSLSSATGVNLDEELSDMIKYQQAYQASARVFSTCNDLLDTLVNLGK